MARRQLLPTPDVPINDPNGRVAPEWYEFFANQAAGMSFPATQIPSDDPNTLDDYEEALWTPVLTCEVPGDLDVQYAMRDGRSTKIGQAVLWSFVLQTSVFTHSTASGRLRVAGFPYFHQEGLEGGALQSMGALAFGGITKAGGYTQFATRVEANQNFCIITASGSGLTQTAVFMTDMPSGGTVILEASGHYRASLPL